jgi:hypothetical protein
MCFMPCTEATWFLWQVGVMVVVVVMVLVVL